MLKCVPTSIFSDNFDVFRDNKRIGGATFNWMTEQGTLTLDSVACEIRKHGPMSGRWTLECDGVVRLEAFKPSAFIRSFNVRGAAGECVLEARRALSHVFVLRSGSDILATIRTDHFFTRRTTIHCSVALPELEQLFSFWLTALMWRRQRNSD